MKTTFKDPTPRKCVYKETSRRHFWINSPTNQLRKKEETKRCLFTEFQEKKLSGK